MLENNVEKERAWNSIKSLMGPQNASDYIIANADLHKLSIEDIETLAQTPPANIESNRKKLLAERVNELTIGQAETKSDPKQYKKAVKLFNKFEPDNNYRRGFAEQKLDEYLSAQTSTTLDNQELNYIKNGIVDIMSPSCSSDAERISLKDNAEKIIRHCATDKGKTMSFAQKWEKFKDTISDIADWLIGRENKAKTLMKENPGIVTNVSKHLVTSKDTNEKPSKTSQLLAKKTKINGAKGPSI